MEPQTLSARAELSHLTRSRICGRSTPVCALEAETATALSAKMPPGILATVLGHRAS